MIAALFLMMLAGCAQMAQQAFTSLPSVQFCAHAKYERTGNTFAASVDNCTIPVAAPTLTSAVAGAVSEVTGVGAAVKP
jgi:hypothetical protein